VFRDDRRRSAVDRSPDLRQRRDGLILPADTLADLKLAAQLTGIKSLIQITVFGE
jgi:hypothetical protein